MGLVPVVPVSVSARTQRVLQLAQATKTIQKKVKKKGKKALSKGLLLRAQALVWGWAPYYRWKYRHIPGLTGIPILGNLPDIISHDGVLPLYRKLHKRFGPVFKVHAMHWLIY